MLRIQDSEGKTKYVLRDEDEEPISIDELILNDKQPEPAEKKENKDAAKG